MSSELDKMLKKIDDDYQEYLDGLSEADRKKALEKNAEYDRELKLFWEKTYPKYSFSKKKQYWLAGTHSGMRSQGEAFADEYSQFSKEWYDDAKSVEPRFDEIFKYVANNLGFEFDWKEYEKRIKK